MSIPYAAGICNIWNSVTVEHSNYFLILNKSCDGLDFSCLSQAFMFVEQSMDIRFLIELISQAASTCLSCLPTVGVC